MHGLEADAERAFAVSPYLPALLQLDEAVFNILHEPKGAKSVSLLLIRCYVLAQDVLQPQAQRSVQRSDIAQQVLLLVQNRFAKLDTF